MSITIFRKSIAIVLSAALVFSGFSSYALTSSLPLPGTPLFTSPEFNPLALKGLILDPNDPLRFHFIVNEGNNTFSDSELKGQSQVLLNYFLAALALPEKDIWVNLSPYEQNRIIPDKLGATEMGKELLGQDYILKQLAASLTHPDTELGKKYWDSIRGGDAIHRVREESFNKVWIIPDHAVVYQDKDRVYIGEAHLKVMMEEDYLAMQKNNVGANNYSPVVNAFKTQILPVIEKEVNTGRNFAMLRQVYHSLILAIWFKKALKETIFYKAYANKQNTKGINTIQLADKNKIYAQYLEAFQKGAYNLVKKDYNPVRHAVSKRAYFSGGIAVPKAFGESGIEGRPVTAMTSAPGRVVTAQVQPMFEVQPATVTGLGPEQSRSRLDELSSQVLNNPALDNIEARKLLMAYIDAKLLYSGDDTTLINNGVADNLRNIIYMREQYLSAAKEKRRSAKRFALGDLTLSATTIGALVGAAQQQTAYHAFTSVESGQQFNLGHGLLLLAAVSAIIARALVSASENKKEDTRLFNDVADFVPILDLLELVKNGQLHPLAADTYVVRDLYRFSPIEVHRYFEYAKDNLPASLTAKEAAARIGAYMQSWQRMKNKWDDNSMQGLQARAELLAVAPPRRGGIEIDTAKMDLQFKGENVRLNPQQLSSIPDFANGAVLHIVKVGKVSDVKALMCAAR